MGAVRLSRPCHSCDVPACCNPRHLWWGTAAENNEDCRRKGRKRPVVGEKHPQAKLTDAQTLEIYRSRASRKELAVRYGVSIGTVNRIKINWAVRQRNAADIAVRAAAKLTNTQ